MFEKSPDDTDDSDIFGDAGQARTKPAGVTHDQVDLHTLLGGRVESPNNVRVLQRVGLQLEIAVSMASLVPRFAVNHLKQGVFHDER